jgi:hypothetical protein
MLPFLTPKTGSARFRLRWLGYDRAQVDHFLRQTAAEREKLQEDLAQLEVIMAGHSEERRRELERLTTLRSEVASCLETSIGALRIATERLSASGALPLAQQPAPPAKAARRPHSVRWRLRTPTLRLPDAARFRPQFAWLARGRARAAIVGVLVAAVVPALLYRSSAREQSTEPSEQASAAARTRAVDPTATATSVVEPNQGVVVTLSARRECWVSMRVDGGQSLDRLLKTGETILLRANDEAVLRIGDAGALSLLINSEPARPLGPDGQIATIRIGRDNYRSLLANTL